MKNGEIQQFLSKIKAIYSNFEVNQETAVMWNKALKDISYFKSVEYLEEHIRESNFVPKPSDILRKWKKIKTFQTISKVHCDICKGKGYIFYYKECEGFMYEHIAYCECQNNQDWKYDGRNTSGRKSDFYIPSVHEVEYKDNFTGGEPKSFDEMREIIKKGEEALIENII